MQLCQHLTWYAATVKAPPSKPLLISHDQVDGWWAMLFTHATVTARIDAVLMERHRISFSACETASPPPRV